MTDYNQLSSEELLKLKQELTKKYNTFKEQNLKLDMSRGKPSPEQLDLSNGMLEVLNADTVLKAAGGADVRNYGGTDGLPEAKELFAQILDVKPEEVIVGGNSSLSFMHDTIARAMLLGVYGSAVPWGKLPAVKFLCPSPGYDRHFAICELFGIEMIVIKMQDDGPDMDQVEKLAKEDELIKGIWCVPKYSNPDGVTYSDQIVRRLASMGTKASDFRIFWDDAYTVHHLTEEPDRLLNILEACKEAGNPDRVFIFTSTSKITYAGGGVSVLASSLSNINHIKKQLAIQTIGPDKVSQLRHVLFLKNMENLTAHMKKQAEIIRPKFDLVLSKLRTELGGKNIAFWHEPKGGYFISLNILDGCAKAAVRMAKDAGVVLTGAGATYPYGKDPDDRNIRVAPTFPSLAELEKAMDILCTCVQLVCIGKISENGQTAQVSDSR